jgi:hypothetical protein
LGFLEGPRKTLGETGPLGPVPRGRNLSELVANCRASFLAFGVRYLEITLPIFFRKVRYDLL